VERPAGSDRIDEVVRAHQFEKLVTPARDRQRLGNARRPFGQDVLQVPPAIGERQRPQINAVVSRDARCKPHNSPVNHTAIILDEEQQDRVDRCLHKAGLAAATTASRGLIRQIEQAMNAFLIDVRGYSMTDRETDDYIRELWHLTNGSEPSIGQIRARTTSAPDQVLRLFDYLASREIPKFYGATGMPATEEQALRNGGFRAWAASADGEALIWAIQTLLPGSGVVAVRGRSRGAGKRSRPHLEPYINRFARGAEGPKPTGGRRSYLDFEFLLIGRLATAVERAIGKCPSAGRSDKTGFGDLVHSVFQWLGMEGQAEYALRQYWKEFARS
jgi:hypothetical protein